LLAFHVQNWIVRAVSTQKDACHQSCVSSAAQHHYGDDMVSVHFAEAAFIQMSLVFV
jgi:hypothetical protein